MSMVITSIIEYLPNLIEQIFNIFKRLVLWNLSEGENIYEKDIRGVVSPFFNTLYALYPCNFISFIIEESKKDESFRHLSQVNFILI